jgi:hypothetical protein
MFCLLLSTVLYKRIQLCEVPNPESGRYAAIIQSQISNLKSQTAGLGFWQIQRIAHNIEE